MVHANGSFVPITKDGEHRVSPTPHIDGSQLKGRESEHTGAFVSNHLSLVVSARALKVHEKEGE